MDYTKLPATATTVGAAPTPTVGTAAVAMVELKTSSRCWKKTSRECYINCNVPELDRIGIDEPQWLESYDESDGVVPDTETQK